MEHIELRLDKNGSVPLSQQIYDQISSMIDDGMLLPGDKLPTERSLCEEYDITRATVKAAFSVLKNDGKITALRGSGSYIAKMDSQSTLRAAQQAIASLMKRFPDTVIDSNELLALFQIELKKRSIAPRPVQIALIDCCVECTDMATAQLSNLKNVHCYGIILDDFISQPDKSIQDAELIFTTAKHYNDVVQLVPQKIDIVKTINMDFTTTSTIELAQIGSTANVMVLCNDEHYKNVMAEELLAFHNLKNVNYMTNSDSDDAIKRQLKKADVLILCKVYANFAKKTISLAINRFKQRGGKVIYCEYVLDRGSLQYSKRQIHQLLEKNKGQ